jgi:hypothetical protein
LKLTKKHIYCPQKTSSKEKLNESSAFFFKRVLDEEVYVYIIESEEVYHFTGMTEGIEKRSLGHNKKTLSFWTKSGNNWRLIYNEEFETKTEVLTFN